MSVRRLQKLTDDEDLIIGRRLKFIREQKGFTLKDVAEGLNVSIQYYQGYEYSRNMPSARIIKRFAAFFDVSIDFLVGLIDVPLPIYRQREKREID